MKIIADDMTIYIYGGRFSGMESLSLRTLSPRLLRSNLTASASTNVVRKFVNA